MRRAAVYLAPAAIVLGGLLAWELAARWDLISGALHIEDFLVPSPTDIATSLWEDRSLLADQAWTTLKEVLLGFLLALACGLGFALLIHLSEALRRAFYPVLVASQTIPIVVIAPILVVWMGFGLGPKLVIVALVCFFPITVNTLDGLRSVDPQLRTMMRTLGASRLQTLTRVELPSALPFIFSGAKVGITVSVIGAVFAEYAGSDSGLGHLINQAQAQLLTARSFAAVVVLSAMAIGLFGLLTLIERRVITWDRPREGASA
jgi:putative hydroxymethylpyrimidine transport system permease protein